ncbi:prepilin-type N-terminal cleavage/methylation domain-containing protein [Bacillus aquiflavi]|uniref:ComG operon protein 3 n=1 Tax=Bacillus aquiflavi TaxID=2672567 RepID=A0A6B3VXB9_9BACI|nr:competence type IV pilus major pilin ComGC [Bacillus aquiflavi]MBA4535805.1 prepilin-type N-terminal cleavage/methylation domain-containing protein [Bacillus aquiflavi]NEY80181.1 prepilin-type N-terminal cleavage/methylation domain-containing protein [Bacillus aquiflavi]UAC47232.1 prepilin-type N-terminal cleavage/methylation domain-containing protein [Bacillus aquiflavi]
MRNILNNERGFTLIEMMIVLLVISVLLIITIPNVAKHSKNINNKGCSAFVKMVEAQVQAYEIDHNKKPVSIDELKRANYIKQTTCSDGRKLSIGTDGEVKIND